MGNSLASREIYGELKYYLGRRRVFAGSQATSPAPISTDLINCLLISQHTSSLVSNAEGKDYHISYHSSFIFNSLTMKAWRDESVTFNSIIFATDSLFRHWLGSRIDQQQPPSLQGDGLFTKRQNGVTSQKRKTGWGIVWLLARFMEN